MFNDADTYLVVHKGQRHFIFNFVETSQDTASWPPVNSELERKALNISVRMLTEIRRSNGRNLSDGRLLFPRARWAL